MNLKGVYKITNTVNDKFYIGSASSDGGFRKRWNEHKSGLRNNRHPNKYLQQSWNKYGEDAFEFEIIEVVYDDIILGREQYYIDSLEPQYNLCKIAGNTKGRKLSDEQKKLLSDLAKLRIGDKNPYYGKKHSKETIELILNNRKDKPKKSKKPVIQKTLNGDFVKDWDSASDIRDKLGYNQGLINCVLNGKGKTAYGYLWLYKDWQ